MKKLTRNLLTDALLVLMLATLGCQRTKQPPKPPQPAPQAGTESVTEIPKDLPRAPAALELSADELRSMIEEQRSRAEETGRELAAARDPEKIRQILLRRKGEILKAQKTIRLSDQITPAQKDSLLQPLERESVRISTQLMNTPR